MSTSKSTAPTTEATAYLARLAESTGLEEQFLMTDFRKLVQTQMFPNRSPN